MKIIFNVKNKLMIVKKKITNFSVISFTPAKYFYI